MSAPNEKLPRGQLPSVKNALKTYYEMKETLNTSLGREKQRILGVKGLSKEQMRARYRQLKLNCVNCQRPSAKGTVFTNSFRGGTPGMRVMTAKCGDFANPCKLNIEIHLGEVIHLESAIRDVQKDIRSLKQEIVRDKNRLLFDIVSAEEVVERFDAYKSTIQGLTGLYEQYFKKLMDVVDNKEEKKEMDEAVFALHEHIGHIKENIRLMNAENNNKYARDAVEIYVNELQPLLQTIQRLKYRQNVVQRKKDACVLTQEEHTPDQFEVITGDKVVHFVLAMDQDENQEGEEDESEDEDENELSENEWSENQPKEMELASDSDSELPTDFFMGGGAQGISWKHPQYQQIWNRLPVKLQNELKQNVVWMEDFMRKCAANKECRVTTPPNILIPPKQTAQNQYNFGVPVYNKVFNKLPESLQRTYLTFYAEDPLTKAKDYTKLEEALNDLVAKEVEFTTFF